MRVDLNTPVITLEVMLRGKERSLSVEAALDTGSTYTVVPWGLAKKLGYAPEMSRERTRIVTASGTEIVPLITLEAAESLGLRKQGLKAACHDLPPQATVSVLLGLNFLRGALTKLDLKNGLLEISDP